MRSSAGVASIAAIVIGLGTAARADVGEPRNLIADIEPPSASVTDEQVANVGEQHALGRIEAPPKGLGSTARALDTTSKSTRQRSNPTRKRALEKALRARDDANYALALLMLVPLAQQGESEAAYHLGLMYEYGLGVERNDVDALKWHRRAAENGHAAGQYSLGLMYFDGRGAGSDPKIAAQWIARAAEKGFAPAQYGLGLLHFNGIGMERDLVRAHMWFELAAARGNESGRENRDTLARQLTSDQLVKARQLASLWKPKNR